MPSWNIHTAHVERLLSDCPAEKLGIADANAFLFGNYVPDIYVGFMVRDASFRIDYCITHEAAVTHIPVSDADRFWDLYIGKRKPATPIGTSLVLGAWAHLVADRIYNGRFREFCQTHETPEGEELRIRKQADFDLFGRSLGASSFVEVTPELLDAAYAFKPYRIAADDVMRTAEVANAIVRAGGAISEQGDSYQLLGETWLSDAFEACNERLSTWLFAWQQLEAEGARCLAADVRAKAGLPPATPDA